MRPWRSYRAAKASGSPTSTSPIRSSSAWCRYILRLPSATLLFYENPRWQGAQPFRRRGGWARTFVHRRCREAAFHECERLGASDTKQNRSPALWGLRPRYRSSSVGASCSVTLAYPVDHSAGCGDGGLLGQRRVELAPACRLEVVAAVMIEVHAVLDYGEVAEVPSHLGAHPEGALVVGRPV